MLSRWLISWRMSNFLFSSVSTPWTSTPKITEAFNSTNFFSPDYRAFKNVPACNGRAREGRKVDQEPELVLGCASLVRSHSLALCFTHSKSFYYRTQNFSRTIANNKISWRNYRFFTSSLPFCSFLAVKSVGLGPFVKRISTSIMLNFFFSTSKSFLANKFPE